MSVGSLQMIANVTIQYSAYDINRLCVCLVPFFEMAIYLPKVIDFNLPHMYLAPTFEFREYIWHQKTKSSWTIVQRRLRDPLSSYFAQYRRVTDRHTDN